MDERFYNIYKNSDKLEVKKYGEVYTPEYIVINMINKIPEEVWNNKNLKVLDFACGCGIFGYFIYKKLIKYFNHNYIVDNILYFNDIQEKNINKIKYIFDNPRNIYEGDFLEWNCNMKFDVIIGNPPFSSYKIKRAKGSAIWHKFVDKLLLLLSDKGYLSLLHPPGWRKPPGTKCRYTHLYEELTQKRQMIYLEIYNSNDGKNVFNCDTRFDTYLVRNIKSYKNTSIIDENDDEYYVDLSEWKFIPNHSIDLIWKLLNCKGKKINLLNSNLYSHTKCHVNNTYNDVYKYPLVHSVRKNKLLFKYSSRNDLGHFGMSKIIITMLPGSNYICQHYIDIEGKYAITDNVFAIVVNNMEEAQKIANSLSTKKFKIFREALNFHTRTLEFRSFYYFKDGIWDEFLKDD